ncbi:MAG TPA: discoidin domain-containing protein [Polyangia bacterium]|jgi:hypothetical protein|nr:discoidin domain-containing protein [Polyangia bacterium]
MLMHPTHKLLRRIELLAPRPAWHAVETGVRFSRAHGRAIRRARAFCATADVLDLARPRDWRRRADRLYARVARTLRGVIEPVPDMPAVGPVDPEPVQQRAHRLLYLAQAPYRRMALAIAALAALAALAVVAVVLIGSGVSPPFRARLFPRDLAAGQSWSASSAVPGHSAAGLDPSTRAPGPFFHTQISDHPWIEIDLGSPRVIRRLQVENRPDCCQTAGLPLNFQVFDEAQSSWRTIVQRRAGFMSWTSEFRGVRARRVRLQVAGSGFLSLRRISLYQW